MGPFRWEIADRLHWCAAIFEPGIPRKLAQNMFWAIYVRSIYVMLATLPAARSDPKRLIKSRNSAGLKAVDIAAALSPADYAPSPEPRGKSTP